MVHRAYAVLDVKANAYLAPMFFPTNGVMLRAFADAVNAADHQFARHPEDYRVAFIGTFDDNNGRLEPLAVPEFIGCGSDFAAGAYCAACAPKEG